MLENEIVIVYLNTDDKAFDNNIETSNEARLDLEHLFLYRLSLSENGKMGETKSVQSFSNTSQFQLSRIDEMMEGVMRLSCNYLDEFPPNNWLSVNSSFP